MLTPRDLIVTKEVVTISRPDNDSFKGSLCMEAGTTESENYLLSVILVD